MDGGGGIVKRQRFSKAALRDYAQKRIDTIQQEWGFDPMNGTAQLDRIGRQGTKEAALAYGQREALLNLMDEFELEG